MTSSPYAYPLRMWPGRPPPLMPVPPAAAASTASTSPLPEMPSVEAAAAAAAATATKLAYKHQRYNQQLMQRWNSDSSSSRRSLAFALHVVRWSFAVVVLVVFAVTLHLKLVLML